ncbi:GNAT family N-acetyltransferase [Micromonospora rhizosphaerae]
MLTASDLVFALVQRSADRLVGFARVLTDGVYLAVVLDVIVASHARDSGVGRMLLDAIVNDPPVDPGAQHRACLPARALAVLPTMGLHGGSRTIAVDATVLRPAPGIPTPVAMARRSCPVRCPLTFTRFAVGVVDPRRSGERLPTGWCGGPPRANRSSRRPGWAAGVTPGPAGTGQSSQPADGCPSKIGNCRDGESREQDLYGPRGNPCDPQNSEGGVMTRGFGDGDFPFVVFVRIRGQYLPPCADGRAVHRS